MNPNRPTWWLSFLMTAALLLGAAACSSGHHRPPPGGALPRDGEPAPSEPDVSPGAVLSERPR